MKWDKDAEDCLVKKTADSTAASKQTVKELYDSINVNIASGHLGIASSFLDDITTRIFSLRLQLEGVLMQRFSAEAEKRYLDLWSEYTVSCTLEIEALKRLAAANRGYLQQRYGEWLRNNNREKATDEMIVKEVAYLKDLTVSYNGYSMGAEVNKYFDKDSAALTSENPNPVIGVITNWENITPLTSKSLAGVFEGSSVSASAALDLKPAPDCTCDAKVLASYGCQCAYAAWKKTRG